MSLFISFIGFFNFCLLSGNKEKLIYLFETGGIIKSKLNEILTDCLMILLNCCIMKSDKKFNKIGFLVHI